MSHSTSPPRSMYPTLSACTYSHGRAEQTTARRYFWARIELHREYPGLTVQRIHEQHELAVGIDGDEVVIFLGADPADHLSVNERLIHINIQEGCRTLEEMCR